MTSQTDSAKLQSVPLPSRGWTNSALDVWAYRAADGTTYQPRRDGLMDIKVLREVDVNGLEGFYTE